MKEITAVRRFQFSAGHRVFGHESKCANLHGHNYVAFVYARSAKLDAIGRVVDFSVLKDRYGTWIDTAWDHGMLLNINDPIVHLYQDAEQLLKMKLAICAYNPTAEEMARDLLMRGPTLMSGTGIEIWRVQLWETENCFAEVEL